MEEIDIIELLQRIKEGNAPKEIEARDRTFKYNEKYTSFNNMYISSDYTFNGICLLNILNNFDTKIKILDKPIIEEIKMQQVPIGNGGYLMKTVDDMDIAKISIKINEIIKHINGENK